VRGSRWPEPKPRGYVSIEALEAIAERHRIEDISLICGYNRQPFNLVERERSVSIDSYCAHFNARCRRTVKDGVTGYCTDLCLLYTKLYARKEGRKKE
jgi:hypothetical protein